ncbi:MAG TPA: TetR/AcrR family transcriptional regulator [Bryobacteraceae bacterium]|nr:TetR/AcrR family transcriptional regulator [Bryobacteraceae bacterium]
MPSGQTRREEITRQRRTAILEAARGVFARQGFGQTVVEDIAAQAGIAKGTLYLYFRSKEDIYMAALLEDARCLNRLIKQRMDAAETWQEKLRAFLDAKLQYLEQHTDFIRIFVAEIRSMMVRGVPFNCEVYEAFREGEGQLAQVFAAATARGEIRDIDPELTATTVCDLTRGILERRLLGWCARDIRVDAEFALDLLCRALEVKSSPSAA